MSKPAAFPSRSDNLFQTPIAFLKGVGEKRADILKTELQIFTFADLLLYYPFRYEDRSLFHQIGDITEENVAVQLKGTIRNVQFWGQGAKKRLEAILTDDTGLVKLVWFSDTNWIKNKLIEGKTYIVYGKPNLYGRNFSISHPDFELFTPEKEKKTSLIPVYHTSEKCKRAGLDSRALVELQKELLRTVHKEIRESLPASLLSRNQLLDRRSALIAIHFPKNESLLQQARRRLKYEELFFIQLQLLQSRIARIASHAGMVFSKTEKLNLFYKEHLPFDLTNAQKRVLREIYQDLKSGKQMNRLLQGDVGSGKTIVAFLCMLLAHDNGAQSCLMAPTEILAEQHYQSLLAFSKKLGIKITLLTGSTKEKTRRVLLEELAQGRLDMVVGTHALLEDRVQFKNLGLCIIDEQHRFGVAQRAKLWQKNENVFPHILVMTATPIPRTLAMTLYGDLDLSILDELPAGRKPVKTVHRFDAHRLRVFGFLRRQIQEGRQAYIVYPLIEESEKMDLKNLEDGYESIKRAFPDVPIGILHGKMLPKDKDFEMQRFLRGETKMMVATTVIEVGVNVPNASVMIIENAERFGLSQLHQLRGRVGRGAYQSYCILMTSHKLSADGKKRMDTMVRTNNGFEIADEDLKLRGAGNLAGTQQSGAVSLSIADLAQDGEILKTARQDALDILEVDPQLTQHPILKQQLEALRKREPIQWSEIS
jgi:ATP-dependent DNA helicase RecG